MLSKELIAAGEEPMKRTIEKVKGDFAALRTGRASTALVEGIRVESYGTMLPLNQVANLGVPDARTIEIRPWDISIIGTIEKAILKSELGLTPANDGRIIRLSLPSLTEDRRKELTKLVHKMAEEFKVAIRNERRQVVESIKKAEKEKKMTEDERKKAEEDSQKLTDAYIHRIDELIALKEKEIMEV